MSTTTTINPTNSGNTSDGKKKAAAFAATAAAAAGVGIAGTHIASELGNEDVISEDSVTTEEAVDVETQPENASIGTSGHTSNATANNTSTPASSSSINTVEPQPITANDVEEPETTIEQVEQTTSSSENVVNETSETVPQNDVLNPNEIAEAIISEERIDINDIDMADLVNFDEIGTVYTVDGESYTAATFHDAAGNGFVMVDVDGDDVFDVITDFEGNPLAEVPGNISVGDAQEDIVDDGEYLAYDGDFDNVDEYGADSLADDLMA